MSAAQSLLKTSLIADPALVMPAGYQFTDDDRRFIDNQIQAIQAHLVNSVISGAVGTWFLVDGGSAALIVGDTVCSTSSATLSVTQASAAALANAGMVTGIVLAAANPGGYVRVAMEGIVAASVTGLATGAAGLVRSTLHRCEKVASLTSADFPIGYVDTAGNLTLGLTAKGIAGSGGGGSTPTGTGIPHIVGGVQNVAASLIVDADVNAAAAIAGTKIAPDFGAQNIATTGAIKIGATVASTGLLRLANSDGIYFRNAANSADCNLIKSDAANNTVMGGPNNGSNYNDALAFYMRDLGAAQHLALVCGTSLRIAEPLTGLSTAWGALNGTATQAMADANQTLASAVYQNSGLITTGLLTANRDVTWPTATDAQSYEVSIFNTCTGAFSVNVKCAAGTAVLVGNGKTAKLRIDSTGVRRVTADV